MDMETARREIKRVDKARKAYHMHYAGYAPGSQENLDVLINSEVFGISGTAQVLADMVRVRFCYEEEA